MPRRVNRPLRRILLLAVAMALLAAACTPESSSDDAAPEGTEPTAAPESVPETTASPQEEPPTPAPPPQEEMLTPLAVDPPVARPSEQVVVSAPFAGTLRVVGPAGVVVEAEVEQGPVTLDLPPATEDGQYLVTVRAANPGISIGDLRVSASDGVWVTADRHAPAEEDVVRIRITSLGLDGAALTLLGLGSGWESQIGFTDEDIDAEEPEDEGPMSLLTPLESGLLVDGGFETTALGDLTNRELLLAGTDADVVQAIVFTEEDAFFSEPVEIRLCNEPGVVAGSIGGAGGVRIVSTSGGVSSAAVLTESGEFSLEVPAGAAMLFGWMDGDGSSAMLEPVPLDVPCGGEVRVGELSGAVPEPSNAGMAATSPPCRTIVLPGIVDQNGAASPVENQVVAGTLRAGLSNTEVISLDDLDAMINRLPETGAILQASNLINVAGVGTPFSGSFYVSGVRHAGGIALASYPSSEGDAESSATSEQVIAASRVLAEAMVDDALCFDADALHARSGETTEWQLEVTDLSGAPYTGAAVAIANEGSGTFDPVETTVEDDPVTFSYTPGPDPEVDPFFADASAGEGPGAVNASVASAAGSGLTWVLIGSKFNEVHTPEGEGAFGLFAGQLGAGVVACAPHLDGPYRGVVIIELANFTELAGLAGAFLDAMVVAPSETGGGDWVLESSNLFTALPQAIVEADVAVPDVAGNWAFGLDPTGILNEPATVLRLYAEAMEGYAQEQAFHGEFSGVSFRGNDITFVSNLGRSIDGVLNPSTMKVRVTANRSEEKLNLFSATITARNKCPIPRG